NAKRVELLKDLMPPLAHVGVLVNPDNPANDSVMRVATQTAKTLNIIMTPVNVRRVEELEAVFERERLRIEALLVVDDGLAIANPRRIAELAIKGRLPSIGFREYCQAGGLAAYGVDFPQIWRSAGAFVDKILKGKKPADLPIEQATRFEFMINMKTAKALSFELPRPSKKAARLRRRLRSRSKTARMRLGQHSCHSAVRAGARRSAHAPPPGSGR